MEFNSGFKGLMYSISDITVTGETESLRHKCVPVTLVLSTAVYHCKTLQENECPFMFK